MMHKATILHMRNAWLGYAPPPNRRPSLLTRSKGIKPHLMLEPCIAEQCNTSFAQTAGIDNVDIVILAQRYANLKLNKRRQQ